MKKQKAIVNCENVKLYCLPKWYINCIIQSNKRRRKVKDSNQNIAKAVLKIRQDNKLSQEQFAEMVGVTRQAVSRWEMGVSVPNINTLILISEKFDIPVDEMLKSGDVVEKIDNNKTPFKKDRNYSIVFLTIGILGLISIPFEMSADDHNCTSHFGVDAFCLALHGADLHIRSGAWSTKHGNCSAWRGCADYLFPAEWCDFAGYGIFDQPDGAAAGCDLAAGKGAEFEICDPGLGVWVNDVNIIWNEKEAGQWEMRPNALLLGYLE